MNRRTFLKDTCVACIGIASGAALLSSCKTMKQSSGTLTENGLTVPLKDFISSKTPELRYHAYLVVRNDALQYPVCVYRLNEKEYTALYMRCSHQGAELQVAGDRLTCPAHGSEFDRTGIAQQGPASDALRRFPVTVGADELFIDLRKQS
ncbi:MAG TPA: Rieske 2Fe-2S domain-containing protein [Chitinophagaceae bacterium]|nr:Rieske 2Fe-2S domain-containing protein [Chitinophagaceae bacterium]